MDWDNSYTLLDTCGGSDVMDTPESLAGKRERAHVEEVADSGIFTQLVDKRCRAGDLHLALFAGAEVVNSTPSGGARI